MEHESRIFAVTGEAAFPKKRKKNTMCTWSLVTVGSFSLLWYQLNQLGSKLGVSLQTWIFSQCSTKFHNVRTLFWKPDWIQSNSELNVTYFPNTQWFTIPTSLLCWTHLIAQCHLGLVVVHVKPWLEPLTNIIDKTKQKKKNIKQQKEKRGTSIETLWSCQAVDCQVKGLKW